VWPPEEGQSLVYIFLALFWLSDGTVDTQVSTFPTSVACEEYGITFQTIAEKMGSSDDILAVSGKCIPESSPVTAKKASDPSEAQPELSR
jgi:hypothetical protein